MTTTLKTHTLAVATALLSLSLQAAEPFTGWTREGNILTDAETGWAFTVEGKDDAMTLKKVSTNMSATYPDVDFSKLDGSSDLTLIKVATGGSSNNSVFKDTGITSITFPDTVTEIAGNSLREISTLTNVVMRGVTTIGGTAFYNGKLQGKLDLPNLLSVGGMAFYGNSQITGLNMPRIETTGDQAFRGCSGIEGELLLTNLTTLGATSFYGCNKITHIEIPKIMKVRDSAFHTCSVLTNVVFNPNVEEIGAHALQSTKIKGPFVFTNLVTLGACAFYGCSQLTQVEIPNVQTIGAQAFQQSPNFASDLILSNVTSIGANAFQSTKITNAVMPKVVSIGQNAFDKCYYLTNVVMSNVKTIGSWGFHSTAITGDLYLPRLKTFPSVVSGKTVTPANLIFYQITELTGIDFPVLTNCVAEMCWNCSGLKSARLPNVQTFANSAFKSCSKLKEFKFAYCAITNGANVFNSSGVTNLYVHTASPLAQLDETVIKSGRSSATVVRYGGVVSDGGFDWIYDDRDTRDYAKSGTLTIVCAKDLTGDVTLPSSLTVTDEEEGVSKTLKVTAIEAGAFRDNGKLATFTIPKNVTRVGVEAFAGCTNLTEILVHPAMPELVFNGLTVEYGDIVKINTPGFRLIVR